MTDRLPAVETDRGGDAASTIRRLL